MSAKLKFLLILILSIFATAAAGVYLTQYQQFAPSVETSNGQTQQMDVVHQSQSDILAFPERSNYQSIPLESLSSSLQGSDPATLALNAFDELVSGSGTRKVEVVYPQRNQALVTITQIKQSSKLLGTIRYRVQMTTFGRSLLVSSPPVWQIVWAGSQKQCWAGNRTHAKFNQNCH
ncbi:MAG: hypothetical protein KME21_18100 [Desmonostoc vinosum HA7617-LM4]|jgi:hypothetical protein|nr:hypothetical protein [Desmonostoc vinosum HA7617-LM4]